MGFVRMSDLSSLGAFDPSFFESAIGSALAQSARGNATEASKAIHMAQSVMSQLPGNDPRFPQVAARLAYAQGMVAKNLQRSPETIARYQEGVRAAEQAQSQYRDRSDVRRDITRDIEEAAGVAPPPPLPGAPPPGPSLFDRARSFFGFRTPVVVRPPTPTTPASPAPAPPPIVQPTSRPVAPAPTLPVAPSATPPSPLVRTTLTRSAAQPPPQDQSFFSSSDKLDIFKSITSAASSFGTAFVQGRGEVAAARAARPPMPQMVSPARVQQAPQPAGMDKTQMVMIGVGVAAVAGGGLILALRSGGDDEGYED